MATIIHRLKMIFSEDYREWYKKRVIIMHFVEINEYFMKELDIKHAKTKST